MKLLFAIFFVCANFFAFDSDTLIIEFSSSAIKSGLCSWASFNLENFTVTSSQKLWCSFHVSCCWCCLLRLMNYLQTIKNYFSSSEMKFDYLKTRHKISNNKAESWEHYFQTLSYLLNNIRNVVCKIHLRLEMMNQRYDEISKQK